MQSTYRYTFLLISSILILLIFKTPSYGQRALQWEVTTAFNATSSEKQSFWLYSNRYGKIDPYSSGGLTSVSVSLPYNEKSNSSLKFALGGEVLGRISKHESLYLHQAFLKTKWNFLELQAGRFEETTGSNYHPLSMGSMSVSGNATPMPKVKIGIPEYIGIPYTRDYLKIRGSIAHGWFESDRYVDTPYLHEKYGYLKISDPLPVSIEAGLMHLAEWGGTHPDFGQLPNTLNDFFRVFTVVGGDENAPRGENIYMLGNHFGYWDFGLRGEFNDFEVHAYRQFYLEDKQGLKFKSAKDGLTGISVISKKSQPVIKGILGEFLYTKWQNGPIPDDGQRGGSGGWKNNYGHYLYRTGWSYFGQTVGTPLLFTYTDRERQNGVPISENWYWENNRIVAQHFGIFGFFSDKLKWKVLATHSKNYGTYREKFESQYIGGYFDNPQLREEPLDYKYLSEPEQWSFLAEFSGPLPIKQPIGFKASIAADLGELYPDNIGLLLSITWNGKIKL